MREELSNRDYRARKRQSINPQNPLRGVRNLCLRLPPGGHRQRITGRRSGNWTNKLHLKEIVLLLSSGPTSRKRLKEGLSEGSMEQPCCFFPLVRVSLGRQREIQHEPQAITWESSEIPRLKTHHKNYHLINDFFDMLTD